MIIGGARLSPPPFSFLMTRRLFIAFLLSVLSLVCYAQKSTTVSFDSKLLDMGEYPADSCVLTKTFTFTNTGDSKLYFYSSRPDCSCITVTLPKKPVAPGRKGTIKVTFDGQAKSVGTFLSWVYFSSNTEPEHYRLRLKATKTEAVQKD